MALTTGYRFWRIETDASLSLVVADDLPHLTARDVVMSRQEPIIT